MVFQNLNVADTRFQGSFQLGQLPCSINKWYICRHSGVSANSLPAGASPTVVNTGSSAAASLVFGIPAGATGAAGASGLLPFAMTGRVYPQQGTGNDLLAIQTAINQCAAAGGGTVDLGNATWNCSGSSGLFVDSSTTSVAGQGAILNFTSSSASYAITIVGSASDYFYSMAHELSGFILNGSPSIKANLYFNGSSSGTSAVISVRSVVLNGSQYGILLNQNTYALKFSSCMIENSTVAGFSILATEENSGEEITFVGCDFANCQVSLLTPSGLTAANGLTDVVFYGCSFDFPAAQIMYLAGQISFCFFGCHFEWTYTANSPFYVAADSTIRFWGGFFAPHPGGTPPYLFQNPSPYQASIVLDSVNIVPAEIVYSNGFSQNPNGLIMSNMVYNTPIGAPIVSGGTLTPDALNGNYIEYTLAANTMIAAPIRPFSGAVLTIMLQQPSNSNYTITFNAIFNWPSGNTAPPTLAANKWLKITASFISTKNSWLAEYTIF